MHIEPGHFHKESVSDRSIRFEFADALPSRFDSGKYISLVTSMPILGEKHVHHIECESAKIITFETSKTPYSRFDGLNCFVDTPLSLVGLMRRLALVALGGAEQVPAHDGETGEALQVKLRWATDGPVPNPGAP